MKKKLNILFQFFTFLITSCASLHTGTTVTDFTPDYIAKTSWSAPDVMERWGAKYKDLQGKIIDVYASSERNDVKNLNLQRAAIVAFEHGYKAFTIIDTKDSSYTYDKFIGGRFVEDTTILRDSKGNIVGTTTSNPRYESTTAKATQFRQTYTIQVLTNENDESVSNIYSVQKYLPQYIKITGLPDKNSEIKVALMKTSNPDTAIPFIGTAKNGIAYCRTNEKNWTENGEYTVVMFINEELYWYTDGKSYVDIEDISVEELFLKLPKISLTNVSLIIGNYSASIRCFPA